MTARAKTLEEDRIDREAAEWFIRRDAGFGPEEARDFEEWLARDPRHAARFARHEESWARFAILEEATPASDEEPDVVRRSSQFRFWAAGALAASLVLVSSLWFLRDRPAPVVIAGHTNEFYAQLYETRILTDGSIVELNRGTRMRTRFDGRERGVWLLEGEAYFHVAKDAERPFVVRAGGTSVRAVGTAFNVRLIEKRVEVLVTEGRILLGPPQPEAAPGEPREMSAHQRSVVPRDIREIVSPIENVSSGEIDRLLAWKPETLEFSATPLGDVVTAFNKRNEIQMTIPDRELASLPIELSFRSENVEAFTRMLELTFDIRAERRGENEIALRRVR